MQSRPNRPPLAAGIGLVSSHRINAQMLSPSTSTCTDAGGPISLPPRSLAHSPPGTLGPPPSASPLTGRYGLSVGPWANGTTAVTRNAARLHAVIHPTRIGFDIAHLCSRISSALGRILYHGRSRVSKHCATGCDRKARPDVTAVGQRFLVNQHVVEWLRRL